MKMKFSSIALLPCARFMKRSGAIAIRFVNTKIAKALPNIVEKLAQDIIDRDGVFAFASAYGRICL